MPPRPIFRARQFLNPSSFPLFSIYLNSPQFTTYYLFYNNIYQDQIYTKIAI